MMSIFKAKQTKYVWHNTADQPPTEEGMYLVILENQGKRGRAHFDMFYPAEGWMQVKGTYAGSVVLWTEFPETPEK